MQIHCLYDALEHIQALKPHPKNPNTHSPDQIKRLAKILQYQGWRYPIKVSKRSGFITSGHGRIAAAKENGWAQVPVNYQEYDSEEQELADVISDNSIAEWAELDLSMINKDIVPMLGPDFDIDLLGLKDFTIDPADKEGECDADEVPDPGEAWVGTGDLFVLGEHRLLCGDSTDANQVARLMNNEKADIWITDPPYGVSYRSNGRPDKHRKIENDSMPLEEMKEFWKLVAYNALTNTSSEAAYYWFACQGGDQMMMVMSLSMAGWKVRHELIWNKDSMVMGRCDYHYKHEPILYGWKIKGTHNWFSDRKQVSVLDFPRPKKSEEHPTMKPVELVQYLIGNNTKKNQLVIDTFLGSGTAIIACEKTNRKCYGMEIDPIYCGIILDRWAKFTGKDPVREDGLKWSEIKNAART